MCEQVIQVWDTVWAATSGEKEHSKYLIDTWLILILHRFPSPHCRASTVKHKLIPLPHNVKRHIIRPQANPAMCILYSTTPTHQAKDFFRFLLVKKWARHNSLALMACSKMMGRCWPTHSVIIAVKIEEKWTEVAAGFWTRSINKTLGVTFVFLTRCWSARMTKPLQMLLRVNEEILLCDVQVKEKREFVFYHCGILYRAAPPMSLELWCEGVLCAGQ